MPRIITLTMNPAIDVSTATLAVEPVRKLRCRAERRDPGGGGVNVARVAHRLGAEVIALYPAGGHPGLSLERLVAAEGVPSHVVPIAGDTREDFSVLEDASGQQFRFVLPGPRLSAAECGQCLQALEHLAGPQDVVCASGSLPPGAPDDFYAQVAEVAARRSARFVLDTSGPALKGALAADVALIKPNLQELRDLTGRPLDDLAAQAAACRALMQGGRLRMVALTLGDQGALLVTPDRLLRAAALPIAPASTVGAGDSFLGAVVWALASGAGLEDALRQGVAAGSAALLLPGSELCQAGDVRRLAAQVVVQADLDGAAQDHRRQAI